jgi:hypothetical protein
MRAQTLGILILTLLAAWLMISSAMRMVQSAMEVRTQQADTLQEALEERAKP